jgi:hypothetical protein
VSAEVGVAGWGATSGHAREINSDVDPYGAKLNESVWLLLLLSLLSDVVLVLLPVASRANVSKAAGV